MRNVAVTLVGLLALSGWGMTAEGASQYARSQDREIKALSGNEISGLLAGEGMGQALAAELHLYPGPKHVLDLAEPLRLTPDQVRATKQAYQQMHRRAVELGRAIVEKERELDRLFASAEVTEQKLSRLVRESADLRGELRLVHLRAHVRMKEILSGEQVERYASLRGYQAQDGKRSPRTAGPHHHGR